MASKGFEGEFFASGIIYRLIKNMTCASLTLTNQHAGEAQNAQLTPDAWDRRPPLAC